MDQTTVEIINMLSVSTLLKLKKQCEAYTTYSIDFKQVNYKNAVKNRQKVFLEILEQVNATLVFKQVEGEKLEEKKMPEQVKSGMDPDSNSQLPSQDDKNNNNANSLPKKAKKSKKGD